MRGVRLFGWPVTARRAGVDQVPRFLADHQLLPSLPQENYEAALDVLNGKLANLLRAPNMIKEKRTLYLEKLGRWRELALSTQEHIRQE